MLSTERKCYNSTPSRTLLTSSQRRQGRPIPERWQVLYCNYLPKKLTAKTEAKGKSIVGAHSIEEFVAKLKKPRRMMMLVMAGKPVDDFIELLLKGGAEEGDIIIDGGNSHYPDTNRRTNYLKAKGIRFVGTGVSGGEEGARYGPSIMPGGNEEAWPYIKVGSLSRIEKAYLIAT